MKKEKTVKEIIAEAKKISMDGNTPGAFELLLNWLSVSGNSQDSKNKIEVLDKATEYLQNIRADALALREKAYRLLAEDKTGSAFIEAQKSLEIFEKFGPEISARLSRELIVNIKREQEDKEKE